jgi:hypothetical protein
VGKKNRKVWLIYAYHRETGEIVAFVWGKQDLINSQRVEKEIVGFRPATASCILSISKHFQCLKINLLK